MLYLFLCGKWSLSREIDNPATIATGFAEFSAHPEQTSDALIYREFGELRLHNQTTSAIKFDSQYRFACHDKTTVEIYFPDGRLFHSLDFIETDGDFLAESMHLCGNDQYCSRYQIHQHHQLYIEHRVSGPQKSYCSRTRYHKLDA